MSKQPNKNLRLISCDLNGTLVHQHTMMDILRWGFPDEPERFKKAKDAFIQQTSGRLSIKEAFAIAGPLTRGLSLRKAITYTTTEMKFLAGFELFISTLYEKKIYFVINSTGYSVTTEVIRALYGKEKIYATICNQLIFGWKGNKNKVIKDEELSHLIFNYFRGQEQEKIYDDLQAVGEVELVIGDENEKANRIFDLAKDLKIPRDLIAHIGDSMGDSGGIVEVARNGGFGIAFNYNLALKNYLEEVLRNEPLRGKIILIEPKKDTSHLQNLLSALLPYLP